MTLLLALVGVLGLAAVLVARGRPAAHAVHAAGHVGGLAARPCRRPGPRPSPLRRRSSRGRVRWRPGDGLETDDHIIARDPEARDLGVRVRPRVAHFHNPIAVALGLKCL